MVQLINLLGKNYVVWDKSAEIKFIKPINKTVFAKFLITDKLLNHIKEEIKISKEFVVDLEASFVDENDITYAKTFKKIFIADRDFFYKKRNISTI